MGAVHLKTTENLEDAIRTATDKSTPSRVWGVAICDPVEKSVIGFWTDLDYLRRYALSFQRCGYVFAARARP